MASAASRGARWRSAAFGYANLVPFIFFALFPFYFMLVTSMKSNAELYNLKAIPFWVQTGLTGGNLGQGAAISLFLFPMLGAVVFFQLRYIRKE